MKQPWDKETQVCTNKVPGVINGLRQGDLVLYRFIYRYIANSLENLLFMNHWPECFLNWHGAFLGQGYLSLFK